MKLRAFALSGAALVAGMVLAFLVPASPAVGFFSPPLFLDVQVQENATLVARGAAVETRIEATCSGATSDAFLSVSVTQRAGSEIAAGFASTRVTCNGQRQTILVVVQAEPGKAFKKGTAFAEAELFACTFSFCGSESDTQILTIDR